MYIYVKPLARSYWFIITKGMGCIAWLSRRWLASEKEAIRTSARQASGSRFHLSSRLFGCLKCSLLLIVRHIVEIRYDHHSLVSHGGYTSGTSDFANDFLFLGVNSWEELVPSPWLTPKHGHF